MNIFKEVKRVVEVIVTNNRFKSLLWRILMMSVAGVIDVVLQLQLELDLSGQAVVVLGLVLAELTKHINNKISK